ncbi:hypothetical protein Xbud_01099 [Xenorhabdus budapestensis]|uniref:Uncharacterized protein n=1 Tax=Xenorhabdus budapestensis TaxID=290110 RepID=A0A2D0J3Q9_XENBU|nr:hypothetical protein Xbud_01099 [Xenorhabdus budapestensis]
MDYQNQGDFEELILLKNIAIKTTDERKHPVDAVILSHPDYHRRLQNHTGSADLCFILSCYDNQLRQLVSDNQFLTTRF